MMAKISAAVLTLFSIALVANCYYIPKKKDPSVVNVAPGIFSKKTESNGLYLPATDTFKPVTTLTTSIHIIKPYTVFVHYQITMKSSNTDFYSKLQIDSSNAGSLVHSGNQFYKTATGFYMANLKPGQYTFKVHYKSPVAINMAADADWQTAILQVMWFEDALAVFDGIKCYPTPPATNAYNNWGPIRNVEGILQLPGDRTVLSAYQFSTEMASPSHVVTSLEVDGFQQTTAAFLKGDNDFLDLHGAWARNMHAGPHYFSIQYRTPAGFSFTDCKEKYDNNKNLYVMMLPPSCKAYSIQPKTTFSLSNSNSWASTDVTYSFTLSKLSHVIIMYQYSGFSGNSHVVMRLSIDSDAQKHTVSLTRDTSYAGNFGLWQGSLNTGSHKATLDYRSPVKTANTVSSDLEWRRYNKWMSRAMTVIIC